MDDADPKQQKSNGSIYSRIWWQNQSSTLTGKYTKFRMIPKLVSQQDYKGISKDLKAIYQATAPEQALQLLTYFELNWGEKYGYISQSCYSKLANLSILCVSLQDIRKTTYTTNAIESLNSVIGHTIKKIKFP